MPPLPSRKSLEAMKRVDLQRLCKDYGVRANLKSEALIDLLLETQTAPPPSPNRRSVSRQASRAGPSRTTSLIIHDIDDEQEDGETRKEENHSADVEDQPPPPPASPPARTRKAKDLQTKLGVGRPKAAGGAGARAVTRSLSVQRGKKAKPSRMLSRVEATIEEEPEPTISDTVSPQIEEIYHVEQPSTDVNAVQAAPSTETIPVSDVSKEIAEAVQPLKDQIQALQSELHTVQQVNTELAELKTQLANLAGLQQRYATLEAEVRELRAEAASVTSFAEELKHLKEHIVLRSSPPPLPSTPKPKSPRLPLGGGVIPSAFKTTAYPPLSSGSSPSSSLRGESTAPQILPNPGVAPSMLGKRHRDSGASHVTGIAEGQEDELSEDELAKNVLRPNRKRAKLSTADDAVAIAGPSRAPSSSRDAAAQLAAPRIPSFTVFSGSDDFSENYLDPPPNNPLPDFFAPPSPPARPSFANGQGTATSSANNEENQNPFNFGFLPISSTPAGPSFLPPFPFPDTSHSPTPAGPSLGYLDHRDDRSDIFREFGLPSPRRPRLYETADTQDGDTFANPASLTKRTASGKQREATSNEVAAGLGLTKVRTTSSTDPGNVPEPPPAQKTMYGTELEGETRFGDFGVEGVASGFWTTR